MNLYMKKVIAIAAWSLIGVTSGQETSFEGDGTVYSLTEPQNGNCNFMNFPTDAMKKYAAINTPQWEATKTCGRCAEVSCIDPQCTSKQTEIVHIVDQCPGCAKGDLDLSPDVFNSITGLSYNRLKVRWKFVDCPVIGNVKYCLKKGSNEFWTAIQPTNFVAGVKDLKINGKSTKMVDSAYYFLLDGMSESKTDLSRVSITLTSVNGEEIKDTVSFASGDCVEGSSQFKSGNPSSPSDNSSPSNPTDKLSNDSPSTPNASPSGSSSSPSGSGKSRTGGSKGLDFGGILNSTSSTSADSNAYAPSDIDEVPGSVSPNNAQEASKVNADDTKEVNTQNADGNAKTSPGIIILSVCAVVGFIVLAVMFVRIRNKKLQDKRNDRTDDAPFRSQSLSSIPRLSFTDMTTPGIKPNENDMAIL